MKNKPKVVFLHGAGGGAWEWCIWQNEFERRGWPTLAAELTPDPQGLEHTRLDHYQDQIIRLLVEKDLEQPVIVGASMGAMLALRCSSVIDASAYILVNPVPPADITHWTPPGEFPTIVRWSELDFGSTQKNLPDADEHVQHFAHQRWRDESGAVLTELFSQTNVPKPDKPILIVLGEADDDVPAEAGNELAEYLRAQVVSYANVSHVGALLGNRAHAIASDVCDWLEHL